VRLAGEHDARGNLGMAGAEALNDAVRSLRELTGYTGPAEYAPARAGDIAHSLADISRARAAFGYEPTVNFHEGLRRTLLWYQGLAAAEALTF
jgi:UDP-glucose 4-epimerase